MNKERLSQPPANIEYNASQILAMIDDLELSRRILTTQCHGDLKDFHEGRFGYLSRILNKEVRRFE